MQLLQNLPWYGYVLLALGIISYLYKYFGKAKEGYDELHLKKAKFKKNDTSILTQEELFPIAFYTPIAEWWDAPTNSLFYKKGLRLKNYLEGWGINTAQGYWGLTEYFMKDGRRWYFDYIYDMIQNKPEEQWKQLMGEKYGENERAQRYLKLLRTREVLDTLKREGILTFDSELELGVTGYDAAVLVGQARKAFTGEVISEEEAWKVIKFARDLALQHFSSWDDFGKSFMIGFALDIRDRNDGYKEEVYHLYKQVRDRPDSPWNTISWPRG